MKVIVCKVCKEELTERPIDCKNNKCPYKESDVSLWEDLLDVEVTVNNQPVGCLNIFGKTDSCLGEFGGCLFLPFKWLFKLVVWFFKIIGKILSVFDD